MSEIYVYDWTKQPVAMLDNYESVLWVDRFLKTGTFELKFGKYDRSIFEDLDIDRYLRLGNSRSYMVIEKRKYNKDGMTFAGRSLESLVGRRIIWDQLTYYGKDLRDIAYWILQRNLFNATETNRKVDDFEFLWGASAGKDIKITVQFTGDNLLEAVQYLCATSNLGFKMWIEPKYSGPVFQSMIYAGRDKTVDNNNTVPVIFSETFENLDNLEYSEDRTTQRTVATIKGEGEGTNRKTAWAEQDLEYGGAGWPRWELYVDARDLSSKNGDQTLSEQEYFDVLQRRGLEKLSEHKWSREITVSVDPYAEIGSYPDDYDLGDYVTVLDYDNHKYKAQVSSVVTEISTNGTKIYPELDIVLPG